jgi:hypothetical protein
MLWVAGLHCTVGCCSPLPRPAYAWCGLLSSIAFAQDLGLLHCSLHVQHVASQSKYTILLTSNCPHPSTPITSSFVWCYLQDRIDAAGLPRTVRFIFCVAGVALLWWTSSFTQSAIGFFVACTYWRTLLAPREVCCLSLAVVLSCTQSWQRSCVNVPCSVCGEASHRVRNRGDSWQVVCCCLPKVLQGTPTPLCGM